MSYSVDVNQRLRLAGELRLRQRQFAEAMTMLLTLGRDPARRQGALVETRYQLGRAIRLRRAAIEEVLSLPTAGPEARAVATEARNVRDRMHARHIANLGYWSAARMEANPEGLVETLAPRLTDLLALAGAEVDAAARYLDIASSTQANPAWLEAVAH